jgi:2-dehydropantoate 2-reductase
MLELVKQTAREAVAVARSLGHEIDEQERVDYIQSLLQRAGQSKASMLQDFDAGRQTEVDVINGAVVRAAETNAVPVPLNRAFLALVKGWESARGLGT